jgi:hypothetical protein
VFDSQEFPEGKAFKDGARFTESKFGSSFHFPAADFIPPSIESTTLKYGIGHMRRFSSLAQPPLLYPNLP